MSEEKVTIRLDLEGEMANNFLSLKKKWGVKNNSELVRILIVQAAEEEKKKLGA